MSVVDALLLVLFGVVLCVWGFRVVRFFASLLVGGLFGVVGFGFVHDLLNSLVLGLVAGFISFVIGLVVGFVVFKLGISLVGGYVLSSIFLELSKELLGYSVSSDSYWIVYFMLFIIFTAIIYIIVDKLAAIGTAVVGAILVMKGLSLWLPPLITIPLAIILATAGSIYQWREQKKRETPQPKNYYRY